MILISRRINSEIWIKENMINLGVKLDLFPREWKYMAQTHPGRNLER